MRSNKTRAKNHFQIFIAVKGKPEEMSIKLAVLGAGGDGKSAVTLRYLRDLFVTDWDPTLEGMHH